MMAFFQPRCEDNGTTWKGNPETKSSVAVSPLNLCLVLCAMAFIRDSPNAEKFSFFKVIKKCFSHLAFKLPPWIEKSLSSWSVLCFVIVRNILKWVDFIG